MEGCGDYMFYSFGAERPCREICCTPDDPLVMKDCLQRCRKYFYYCVCPTFGPTTVTDDPITTATTNHTLLNDQASTEPSNLTAILTSIITVLAVLVCVISLLWWRRHRMRRKMAAKQQKETPDQEKAFLENGGAIQDRPEMDPSIRRRPSGGCLLHHQRVSLMGESGGGVPVTDGMLDDLDVSRWCKAYMVQDGHVEIHQGLDVQVTFTKRHLQNITFGMMKQYLPSELTTRGPHLYTDSPTCLLITCAGQIYGVTAGSGAEEGRIYTYTDHRGHSRVLGECISVLRHSHPPTSYNIALLRIDPGVDVDSYNALPRTVNKARIATRQEIAEKECWGVHFLSNGSRRIRENAYIKHSTYTNKVHGLHRAVTLMKQTEEDVMLDDVIGSLVTSSVSGAGHMTIYGVLIGRLTQSKGELVQFYVVTPLEEVLEAVKDCGELRGGKVEVYCNHRVQEKVNVRRKRSVRFY